MYFLRNVILFTIIFSRPTGLYANRLTNTLLGLGAIVYAAKPTSAEPASIVISPPTFTVAPDYSQAPTFDGLVRNLFGSREAFDRYSVLLERSTKRYIEVSDRFAGRAIIRGMDKTGREFFSIRVVDTKTNEIHANTFFELYESASSIVQTSKIRGYKDIFLGGQVSWTPIKDLY